MEEKTFKIKGVDLIRVVESVVNNKKNIDLKILNKVLPVK